MGRPRKTIPEYQLHQPSGRAYVRFRDSDGERRTTYLGAYGSPESRAEYERVLAEIRSGGTLAVTKRLPLGPRELDLLLFGLSAIPDNAEVAALNAKLLAMKAKWEEPEDAPA